MKTDPVLVGSDTRRGQSTTGRTPSAQPVPQNWLPADIVLMSLSAHAHVLMALTSLSAHAHVLMALTSLSVHAHVLMALTSLSAHAHVLMVLTSLSAHAHVLMALTSLSAHAHVLMDTQAFHQAELCSAWGLKVHGSALNWMP